MPDQSPTPTLDAAWDTLLEEQPPALAPAEVAPAVLADALADVAYFHEQGLVDDAMAMLDDLRHAHPDEPSLRIAPWDHEAVADDQEPWPADEEDILHALDLLGDRPEFEAANESRPGAPTTRYQATSEPMSVEDEAQDAPAASVHDAITIVERPIRVYMNPAPRRDRRATVRTPTAFASMPTSVEGVLEPIDAVALQADWFDDAVASLRRLQADEADEALADEWEIDLEEDDDWDDDEVDIDTAELEAPAPAETLSYLPHDLAEMRQAASSPTVTDTLPYRDYEAPRMPLEIIPGGID